MRLPSILAAVAVVAILKPALQPTAAAADIPKQTPPQNPPQNLPRPLPRTPVENPADNPATIPTAPADLAAEEIARIRNAIIGQIDAFKADDAAKAFSFAAPGIRRIFRTPEMFLHMVRKSYRSLYRPRSYAFEPLQRIDGNLVQPLIVVGPSGVSETALYVMEAQPDGSWKIGACIMASEPGEDT